MAKRPAPPAAASKRPAPRCIVGIGASAGGFEPIRALVNAVPPDSGLALVVIQHLVPTHKSLAADLLRRQTAMPVVEAKDGMRAEANCIYTAPADHLLSIARGVLRLSPLDHVRGPRLPIDHFFNSLGADQHEKAIGIILSGTGTDGTLGAKTIAANDGIVLAQAPETAQFDGMPRSAINTGAVNQVLPVKAIPKALVAYARHAYAAGNTPVDASGRDDALALENLLAVIRARRDFDFSGYKRGTLLRRVRRRMAMLSIDAIGSYCALILRAPDELDALVRDLLIGVTEFFRDPPAWEALRTEVIAPLVAAHTGKGPLRAWIPGCATGEEAYTLAMLLLAALKDAGKAVRLQVFATDVNEEALQLARAGIYPLGIATHIPPALLRRHFFDGAVPGHFQVTPELRSVVTFSRHNVFADPPFSRLDLISCRNLLIYLEPQLQDRILALFRMALKADGHLFLGSAETAGNQGGLFAPVSKKWRIFRVSGTAPRSGPLTPVTPGNRGACTPQAVAPAPAPRAADAASIARQLILDRYAPAAVLVNSNFDALYYSGPTEKFLARPSGVPTLNLLLLAREGLRSHLRDALRKAATSNRAVSVINARVKRGKQFVPVRITIAPAPAAEPTRGLFLAVFEELPPPAKATSARSRASALARALEAELRATRNDLQNSIENLETSNQNLTAAHQEMLSNNEELQSINEELESSKEELQSMNEELNTVNQQLQNKVAELELAHGNLANVIASSEIATLWLDRDLRIKWSTPAMQKAFHVLPTDAGRPVSDFGSPLTDAGLLADARAVIRKRAILEHEQSTADGRHYLRRIVPFHAGGGSLEGVIVTYADITTSWRTATSALNAKKFLAETLEEQVRERTAQLRDLAFALTTAEEQERRNLAQNLHDDLAQVLSIVQLKLAAAAKDGAAAPAALAEAKTLLDQASVTVHSLAFQLSPAVLYQLGLMPAIDWLAEEMLRLYGLRVAVHDDGAHKPLDERVRSVLYRAVRELLINVAKHAKVHTAEVHGTREANRIIIEVTDGGAGFDAQAVTAAPGRGGFGLISVRERLRIIGGSVNIASLPGDGTTVTLAAPLLEEAHATAEQPA